MMHVILDGTLIESDRLAGVRESSTDLWSAPTTWAPRDDPYPQDHPGKGSP